MNKIITPVLFFALAMLGLSSTSQAQCTSCNSGGAIASAQGVTPSYGQVLGGPAVGGNYISSGTYMSGGGGGCATGNCGGGGGCATGNCGGGGGCASGNCGGGAYQDVVSGYGRVGPGRGLLKALVDDQFTRTLAVYGGAEDFITDGSDLFGGAAGVDNGFAGGIEIGRRHTEKLRSAFDFTYRDIDFASAGTTGDAQVYSLMKNVAVDFTGLGSRLTPYAGFGLGYAHVDGAGTFQSTNATIDDGGFAYQGYAGLSWRVQPKAQFYVEYRYFAVNDVEIEMQGNGVILNEGDYSANNVFLGLRFGY